MGAVLSLECERARQRASLALDRELSPVEEALLRAHVGRCADCAGFEGDLGRLTHAIRKAPLERPARAGVPVRRRSAGSRALQLGAAAAAIVVAAVLGSVAGSLPSSHLRQEAAVARPLPQQEAIRLLVLSNSSPPAAPERISGV